jgi:tetratricopeptide (TPR) repeat protein
VYDSLDRAKEYADTAMRLDPTSHVVHGAMALTLYFRGDYERAKMESVKTIELNPNDALWLALMGLHLIQQEEFELGGPMYRRAVEVDPHPPPWSGMGSFVSSTTSAGTRRRCPTPGASRCPVISAHRFSWRRCWASWAEARRPLPISRR